MIDIVAYSEAWDEAVNEMDPSMALEIHEHGDVLPDTVICALSDGQFAGAGYLTAGPSFRLIDRDLPYYHIHLNFKAVPDSEEEIEASAGLLGTLMQYFLNIQGRFPDKRLILRTWCSAGETAYLDFLESAGFTASRVMLKMEQDLVYDPQDSIPEPGEYFEDESYEIASLDPEDTERWSAYFELNEQCFLVPDSEDELLYRMDNCGAEVYLLLQDGQILSSVSVWNKFAPEDTDWEEGLIATENIFTAPGEQGKGYAGYLLSKVLYELAEENASIVTLNVYADDLAAVSLYQKLGYETVDQMLEMHFEKAPRYLPY